MDAYLHTGPVFPDQADRLALGPLELGVSDMPQKGWFIKLFQYVKPIYNCLTCQILYQDNRNTDYSDTASWNKETMTEINLLLVYHLPSVRMRLLCSTSPTPITRYLLC